VYNLGIAESCHDVSVADAGDSNDVTVIKRCCNQHETSQLTTTADWLTENMELMSAWNQSAWYVHMLMYPHTLA